MKKVVIVEAVRTALGRLGGALRDVECDQLTAVTVKECIRKTELPPGMINEVIMEQVKMTTDAANLARVTALLAGIPVELPAYSIMHQCRFRP